MEIQVEKREKHQEHSPETRHSRGRHKQQNGETQDTQLFQLHHNHSQTAPFSSFKFPTPFSLLNIRVSVPLLKSTAESLHFCGSVSASSSSGEENFV
ncbi:hypothetical protein AKJ16_DCAP06892 [Drosera capensis]